MSVSLSTIKFPHTLSVTEQAIDISMSQQQQQFYIDLLNELLLIYNERKKPRLIVGVSGPSGSGKSVISMLFKEIAQQAKLPFVFDAITIDAFHYTNAKLVATDAGDGTTLKAHKGRYDTYDTGKLASKLAAFSNGENVSFPIYSRVLHEPVEDSIHITAANSLLLVEGLWLLYPEAGWEKVGDLITFHIFVTADKERSKELVIKRHMKGGRTMEDAENYFNKVDSVNFDLVMQTKDRADLVIPPFYQLKL